MEATNSQGKPEEKNKVPWRITFTRKDLLSATWDSKKGADLLYHFLHRASWEAKNQKLAADLNDIKIQSVPSKALEAASLSLGSYHTYLKLFVEVGYVSTEPYSKELTVHLATIKDAFTKAPEKPIKDGDKPKRTRSKSFNLKDCNFVTLPLEDYENLISECFKLKEMFQSLKDSGLELKEMFQSLKQNATIDDNQEASAEALSDSQSNALEIEDALDFFSEGKNPSCSQTPLPTNDEKKNAELQQRIAELEQQVTQLTSSQENSARLQEKHNNQSTISQQTVATQAPLIAETVKPKRTFPDMRSDLNERNPSQPLTSKEQERLDAAEQRHKEAMAKKREPEIWQHYALLLETPVSQIIKDDFSKRAMKALIAANATDEHITLTFKYLKNKKLATTLAFIASNLNSVVSSQQPQQKPKSDLLDMTYWTDDDWDTYRRTGNVPACARRA